MPAWCGDTGLSLHECQVYLCRENLIGCIFGKAAKPHPVTAERNEACPDWTGCDDGVIVHRGLREPDRQRGERVAGAVAAVWRAAYAAWRRWRQVTAESSAAPARSAAGRYSASCSAPAKAAYPAWMIRSTPPC